MGMAMKQAPSKAHRKGIGFTVVDLFCGSGGLATGLQDAGLDVVAAFDAWDLAVATYCRNLADHAHVLDLADVETAAQRIGDFAPDLIVGGPPCQDFSSAGKRVEASNANLTVAFGNIVLRCKPDFFLMENVPQARMSRAYTSMRQLLSRDGYKIDENVLNASLCGVPQSRRRFFSFGARCSDAIDRYHQSLKDRLAKQPLTIKEYMGREIDIEFYYRHPRNYSRRSVFSVYEPSPTIRSVNRPVPPNYPGHHLDSAMPSTVRPLTSAERSRIQTFPKSWDWAGSDRNANVEIQIGNAVPVNLGAFVGAGIVHAAE